MKFRIFLLVFLILFSLNGISAKFVCGEVLNSPDNVSPSWYEVSAYYFDSPLEKTSCFVSPDDNKYCCDLDAISSRAWAVGDVVGAKVINLDTLHVSGPVNVSLTDEAYDIFPQMELKKIYDLNSPLEKIYFLEEDELFFNLTLYEPYDDFYFDGNLVCLDCSNYLENISVYSGYNVFEFNFEGEGVSFFDEISFGVLKNYSVSREFLCEGCGNKIKKGEKVNVSLNISFSDNMHGFYYYEYVPIEWNIEDYSDAQIVFSDLNYNVLSWRVLGNTLTKSYYLSEFDGDESSFIFNSYLEDLFLSSDEYKFYSIFPSGGGSSGSPSNNPGGSLTKTPVDFNKSIVDSNFPIVSKNDSFEAAIYSKKFQKDKFFGIFKFDSFEKVYNRSFKFFEGYVFQTNVDSGNFSEFKFEYVLNKSKLSSGNEVEFYGVDSKGNFLHLTGEVVSDNENEVKYALSSESFLREVVIFEIKDNLNFWDKFIHLFWRVTNKLNKNFISG